MSADLTVEPQGGGRAEVYAWDDDPRLGRVGTMVAVLHRTQEDRLRVVMEGRRFPLGPAFGDLDTALAAVREEMER